MELSWRGLERRGLKRGLLCGALAFFAIIVPVAAQKADISGLKPQNIKVVANPFDFERSNPKKKRFGRLTWRGGLVLRSRSDYFGGYSGLALSRDGTKLLAVSDSGSWLSAGLRYKDGVLSGLSDTKIGPIPQKDGRPIQDERARDAESLTPLRQTDGLDGRYLIGFENQHRLEEYRFEDGEMHGPLLTRPRPPQLYPMRLNQGYEGVTTMRGGRHKGAMVAFAERKLTKAGDHTGALVIGKKAHPIFMKRHAEFDITALDSLADGRLLVLERSFIRSALRLEIRLRLIEAKDIKPGAILGGEVLLETGTQRQIDNFEAMDVRETEAGETIITLLSDDNFNFFQRTMLSQFSLD